MMKSPRPRRHAIYALFLALLCVGFMTTACKSSSSTSSSASGCGSAPTEANETTAIPNDPDTPCDDKPIDTSCPTSNTTAFAKTKFVLHSGLAFGAFHRWLWKPFKAGTFKKGANGRIKAFIKGGLAALFVKREVRLASEDVKANPALCKALAQPLANIGDSVKGAFDKMKGGDASGLTSVEQLTSQVESTSQKDGVPIKEDENGSLTSTPK